MSVAELSLLSPPTTGDGATPVLAGRPVVGVLPEMRRDPMGLFTRAADRHGGMVGLNLGTSTALLVTEPELVKHILQDGREDFVKSSYLRDLHEIVGDGIFLNEGEAWKRSRLVVQKCFHSIRFDGFVAHMTGATAETLERWRPRQRAGETIDLVPESMRLALDIILRTMFSRRLDREHEVLFHSLTWLLRDLERRFWRLVPTPRWAPTPANAKRRRMIRILDAYIYELIEQRRRERGERDDLLGRLMAAYDEESGGGSSRILRNEVLTFLIAGQDTTACTLAWTWAELSRRPELARRFHDEVDAVTEGRTPRPEDLDRFAFGARMLKESLRLNPPAWTFSREPRRDVKLGGVPVKKGTLCIIPPYAIHRRSDLWDNPEGFDPDRFLPDAEAARHRYAYLPFGGGPRVCIGARFATMEALTVLAMTGRAYRVDLAPGRLLAPEPMFIQRPRGGLPARLALA